MTDCKSTITNFSKRIHTVCQLYHRLFTATTIVLVSHTFGTSVHAEFEYIKIGDPTFEPTRFAMGPVTLERTATGGDDFRRLAGEWRSAALGDHFVLSEDPLDKILYPGERHAGPFDDEVLRAYAGHGQIQTDVITATETRGRRTMQSAFAFVPNGTASVGNSPDTAPIIPEDVFPLQYRQILTRNGEVDFEDNKEFRALSDAGVLTDQNGVIRDFTDSAWSHLVIASGVGAAPDYPTTDLIGNFERRETILDASGENGWEIISRWEVVRRASRLDGDLSHNDELDLHDLNILIQNVAVDATNPKLDLNDDDAVNFEDVRYWVSDLKNTWIGDANLDGVFNSGDFVDVFTAGKYETDAIARWSEGDWNSDERFDSGDFVVAFQGGGYEMGIRQTVAAVPEPSGCLLQTLGLLTIVGMRCSTRRTAA